MHVNIAAMNCAERLVELFGSQAEVARRFTLDRAVVNNWVKSGYVPARWAMEVEQVTGGDVSAADVLNEATARKPNRLKSRPDGENLYALNQSNSGSDTMSNNFLPSKRISSFHPPQRSTFSIMRPPNTPLRHTMTLSPGATMLTKQNSMPTEPGPEIGNVSGFLGRYT